MTTIRTFMDIALGGAPPQRVMFELWPEKQPKSVENFRALCTGEKGISRLSQQPLHYRSSVFHRVIPSFMIQGGDFTKRNGSGGESIYGGHFPDEDLTIPIDSAGLLCMANRGPDTNGSQFFITLGPAEHLNGKHVVFGKVVKGFEHIEHLAQVETGEKDKPVQTVTVVNCGELVRATKAAAAVPDAGAVDASRTQRVRSASPSDKEPDSDSSEEARRQRRKARKAKRAEKEERKSRKKGGDEVDSKTAIKGPHVETMDELDARLEREENERLEADRLKKLEDLKRQLEDERKKQGSGGVVYKGRGAMRYLDPENIARHKPVTAESYSARSSQQRQPHVQQDRPSRPARTDDALDYEGRGSGRERSRSPERGGGGGRAGAGGIEGDWRVAREAQRTRVEGVKMVAQRKDVEGEKTQQEADEERIPTPTMKRGESRSESDESDMAMDD